MRLKAVVFNNRASWGICVPDKKVPKGHIRSTADKLMPMDGGKMLSSADVVVIGGGAVGISITYYLAKYGVQVCLVEKADLCAGASRACLGHVMLQTKTAGPKLGLARESVRLFHSLEKELQADFEFENKGSMIVAQTEMEADFVRTKVRGLQDSGIDATFVNAAEARSLQPALSPHIFGASYCTEDCIVNPLDLILAYARAAERLGATIRMFTEVVGIERQGNRISAVLTNRGQISTETVVNATGAWAPVLAGMVNLDLPVVPRKGEMFVTEPMPPMLTGGIFSARYLVSKEMPVTDADADEMRVGMGISQTQSGNLLVGSTREFAGFDRKSTYRAIQELVRQPVELLPSVSDIHIIRAFAGLRPATPDGLPILEQSPELPGFITASGHEGDGVALSPITGKTIAELVVGKVDKEKLIPFSSSRFAA